jgi:glycosyltransferase involved in cell wall biosynthesis
VPPSLGALKNHNVDPERWEPLRIDERIAVEKEIIPELDGVAATSSAIRESMKNDYGRNASLFLPPCVETDRIHPREVAEDDPIWEFLSQRCSLSPEQVRQAKIVTEISRTDTTKRKDVLIKAFAEVLKHFPDSLLIVSVERDTPLGTELDHLARELDVLGNVAFVGSVWALLPVIYSVTHVYCTPSVMEGFGMSAQEAAATAVPVVSSDLVPFVKEFLLAEPIDDIHVEGTGNAIHQGQGAIMVKADDIPGFTGAICRLLTEETLRYRMGKKAYEITIPYFSWKEMVSRFFEEVNV